MIRSIIATATTTASATTICGVIHIMTIRMLCVIIHIMAIRMLCYIIRTVPTTMHLTWNIIATTTLMHIARHIIIRTAPRHCWV
jgi:hypothetical protein